MPVHEFAEKSGMWECVFPALPRDLGWRNRPLGGPIRETRARKSQKAIKNGAVRHRWSNSFMRHSSFFDQNMKMTYLGDTRFFSFLTCRTPVGPQGPPRRPLEDPAPLPQRLSRLEVPALRSRAGLEPRLPVHHDALGQAARGHPHDGLADGRLQPLCWRAKAHCPLAMRSWTGWPQGLVRSCSRANQCRCSC